MYELIGSQASKHALREEPDALLAVVALGLIDAAYPALMAGNMLQRHDLPAELRQELVGIVVDKTRIVMDRLQDLLQGVPPELFRAMETLSTRVA